jgi:hypothetical protein
VIVLLLPILGQSVDLCFREQERFRFDLKLRYIRQTSGLAVLQPVTQGAGLERQNVVQEVLSLKSEKPRRSGDANLRERRHERARTLQLFNGSKETSPACFSRAKFQQRGCRDANRCTASREIDAARAGNSEKN